MDNQQSSKMLLQMIQAKMLLLASAFESDKKAHWVSKGKQKSPKLKWKVHIHIVKCNSAGQQVARLGGVCGASKRQLRQWHCQPQSENTGWKQGANCRKLQNFKKLSTEMPHNISVCPAYWFVVSITVDFSFKTMFVPTKQWLILTMEIEDWIVNAGMHFACICPNEEMPLDCCKSKSFENQRS